MSHDFWGWCMLCGCSLHDGDGHKLVPNSKSNRACHDCYEEASEKAALGLCTWKECPNERYSRSVKGRCKGCSSVGKAIFLVLNLCTLKKDLTFPDKPHKTEQYREMYSKMYPQFCELWADMSEAGRERVLSDKYVNPAAIEIALEEMSL